LAGDGLVVSQPEECAIFIFHITRGATAKAVIVLLTAGLFGLAHQADQGVAGMQQATITGLVFGTAFALTGRIWPVMIAHAAFDVTAVALIYWRLEAAVAHLLLK